MSLESILSIVSGGAAGAVVTWLLRAWLSARITGSISHAYAQQLENHKAEIGARLAALGYDFQRNQLQTQLFFDHQRSAFSEILMGIVEVKKAWLQASEPEFDDYASVPFAAFQALTDIYYRHQLFLDSSCAVAVELVLACMRDSLPVGDASGRSYLPDAQIPLERVAYLQPRLADQFRNRLGVDPDSTSEREIAILGGLILLNRYHFQEIDLPPTGVLHIPPRESPGDTVTRGAEHVEELAAKLSELSSHLRAKQRGVFHEAVTSAERYVRTLHNTSPRASERH